ncbi:MAG: ubiquitin-like protein Pup [Propionibacteriaceae bacterium]|nr:ubiquitin-like protein Pup [Propionibacteriaceae bacterium]
MSERIQRQRQTSVRPETDDEASGLGEGLTTTGDAAGLDALLAEIDTVLESDAEEYVRGFVQKGGQ